MSAYQFKPLPKQEEFILSPAKQKLLSGSFGAGKSRVGCEAGYALNCRYPGNRGLICRKAMVDVKSSTIRQTLLEEVIPDSHIVEHNKSENVIRHKTGTVDDNGDPVLSEIFYYGVDAGSSDDDLPRKIGSTSFGWIFVDEGTELDKGEWNQLLGRLRYDGKRQNGKIYKIPIRQIFTATNPDSPTHWMHEHFGLGGGTPDNRAFWRMNLDDNKHLPEDYVKELKSSLSGIYYDRYILGKWVGAEGIVYDEFRPETHFIGPEHDIMQSWSTHGKEEWDNGDITNFVRPPETWEIYRAIDFGYTNPFVCQWWAHSPDDELVLFRELYKTKELVEDMAKQIQAFDPHDRDIAETYADHDAEDSATLRRHGVHTTNAKKDVSPGIQDVKSRFALDDRGRPRIYMMRGSRCHQASPSLVLNDKPKCSTEEISGYKWKDNSEEDKPVKENDHGMDAMRYLVHTLDGGNSISHEEMESWTEAINEGL